MRKFLQSHYKKTLTIVAVSAFLWLLANQRQAFSPAVVQELSGQTMGTTWHVQVVHAADNSKLDQTGVAIETALARLDKRIFSTYVADSELSRLNTAAVGTPVPVSRELMQVLLLARTVNQQSFGTFDVTVGALVNLWGFGPQSATAVPDDKAIAAAMKHLGASHYEIDARAGTVTRTADISLDLSAIAKGYAVDHIAELLQAAGYSNYLVEIGGEVRVQGWRQPEQSWVIAIESPQNGPQQALARIDNHGAAFALAGSGVYRNFFEQDGKRYSHEIDPHTGKPIDHALAAVTVLAETDAEADAWATAMMVLGPEAGPLLAEKRGLAVYFIIRKGEGFETRHTPGFDAYLKLD